MNLIEPFVKITRAEVGVSKHVPLTHFNSPTIMEAKNGAIFSVIKLSGVPFDTEKTDVLNGFNRTWHRALSSLDERFAVLGTIHRRKASVHLTGKFTNDFSKSVDDAYLEQFSNQTLYVNDLYLTVVYKGLMTGKLGKLSTLFNQISGRYVKEARESTRAASIKALKETVFQLQTSLSVFGPHLVGCNDEDLGYSELLSFVSLFVNGGQALRFKKMAYHSAIDKNFAKTKAAHSLYPHGNISQCITAKRIFFGECIQFQGSLKSDTRFGAMVTVKHYGSESASIMLDPLLHLDAEFISTNSFLMENKAAADKTLNRHTNKMRSSDDPAISQIEGMSVARDQLASDKIALGYHHNTVMLLCDSIDELEQQVASTILCYMNAGFVAVRETLGLEAAFWAQIPTNFKYMARSSLISSQNFVDFFPLHNYRTGFFDGNHLGSALTLVETPSRTPLWLNLHSRGPKDNPAPGHTTLIGGNGSGKTVMMCFLDAELNRYGGRSFFFDRNRGAEIYIRASRGYYAVLSPNHADDIQFNPLQLADTPSNRQFCKNWIVQLVKDEEGNPVDEESIKELHKCIDYSYDQLHFQYRNLTNATKMLPITFTRRTSLRRWLRADDENDAGPYAYLFDNDVDALAMQTKMGFDMTHFLDEEPAPILAAVTMYLFQRLEESLDGTLTSVFLDEAWQYLDNPYWQAKLKRWLPTLRKLNCHLVFATQSPKSVADSPISHTILDNCATNIYFANPQAKEAHYIDGFNLSESEFSCIKENEPQSRLFLYKQGHESALAKLNLSHLKDLLKVMSGTQSTVNLLDKIRAELKAEGQDDDDPSLWLPIFLKRSQRR